MTTREEEVLSLKLISFQKTEKTRIVPAQGQTLKRKNATHKLVNHNANGPIGTLGAPAHPPIHVNLDFQLVGGSLLKDSLNFLNFWNVASELPKTNSILTVAWKLQWQSSTCVPPTEALICKRKYAWAVTDEDGIVAS